MKTDGKGIYEEMTNGKDGIIIINMKREMIE